MTRYKIFAGSFGDECAAVFNARHNPPRQNLLDSGTLTDGSGAYADDTTYVWSLRCSDKTLHPTLTFKTFNTEEADHFSLYDGVDARAPLIARFSGMLLPQWQQASGTLMTADFTSDGMLVHDGFDAEFTCLAGLAEACDASARAILALPACTVGRSTRGDQAVDSSQCSLSCAETWMPMAERCVGLGIDMESFAPAGFRDVCMTALGQSLNLSTGKSKFGVT